MKAKFKWLDRRVTPAAPYFTLCLTEEDYKAATKHLELKETVKWVSDGANATTHIMNNPEGKSVCLVCIKGFEGREPSEVAGLLIHEAVHVWQEYLRSIHETSPSSEFEAYGIQNIAQELIYEFGRRMKGESWTISASTPSAPST
jgi:hypothetical protein